MDDKWHTKRLWNFTLSDFYFIKIYMSFFSLSKQNLPSTSQYRFEISQITSTNPSTKKNPSISQFLQCILVPLATMKNITNHMTSLNHDFTILWNWFDKDFLVLNPDKFSFMLFGVKDELQTDNVTTLLLEITEKKSHWESLLITSLTSLRILLALRKMQI